MAKSLKPKRGRAFFGDFKDAVKLLRENLRPAHPVRVSLVKLKEDAGDCDLIRRRFYIRVDKQLCKDAAILVLFHEWAHALSWRQSIRVDHGQAWGNAYSKIWRLWTKTVTDQEV